MAENSIYNQMTSCREWFKMPLSLDDMRYPDENNNLIINSLDHALGDACLTRVSIRIEENNLYSDTDLQESVRIQLRERILSFTFRLSGYINGYIQINSESITKNS
jgi:hypothetical protein